MSVIEQRPAAVTKTGSNTPKKKDNSGRYLAHVGLAIISAAGCGLAALYKPDADIAEVIAIGTGYIALLMIAATLVIGPINLFRKRRNPVNIDLRRDVGIWAGINVIVHVIFSFQVFQNGQILQYFVGQSGEPRTDLFGLSNYVGLIALIVLLPILVTSNQISLKFLKGKCWKSLQRLTYGLMVLGVLHTVGFILYNARETVFSLGLTVTCLAVIAAQTTGVVVTLHRNRQKALVNATPVAQPALVVSQSALEMPVARRQFIRFIGGTVLAGVAMGTSASLVSHALSSPANATEVAATDLNTSSPPIISLPTAGSNNTLPSTNNGTTNGNTSDAVSSSQSSTGNLNSSSDSTATSGSSGQAGSNISGSTPTSDSSGGLSGSTPTSGSTSSVAPKPTTPATSSSSNSAGGTTSPKGTVLATISSLAAGKALAFTTPGGNSAFLVHRTDGSVACFSGICTHEPVALVYEEAQQVLYCPRHDVSFNTQNGSPASRPARRALASYSVSVDGKGNIIYPQS